MRRFLFIILLCVFVPHFECFKSDDFYVARRDSNEAICVWPISQFSYFSFPIFDLDKLQIPRDVGFMNWDWLSDWQLQNDTNVRLTGQNRVLIAGNQPFHFVGRVYPEQYHIHILASNITLWAVNENGPRGAGMLFEFDHFNETTHLKDSTLKYCDHHPEDEGANCTIVDYKNGTNFLNDGNHWTQLRINFELNRNGVEMFKKSNGEENSILQWSWNKANFPNPFSRFSSFAIFAKSHQRNAALLNYGDSDALDFTNNNQMKRNYTQRYSGKLFVMVKWNSRRFNDAVELLKAKNLASGLLAPDMIASLAKDWSLFRWFHLDAGEYEFTLDFDHRKPRVIYLYRDNDLNIVKTWKGYPKAITKCQLGVGLSGEYFVGPSSTKDTTLKPRWNLDEWANVCSRLGIGSNDTEVPIEFCNFYGCNFSKCPHLHE